MTGRHGQFAVELPLYSGPFGLLVELIFGQKMDVCDVPVGAITARFLQEGLEKADRWSLEETTWFLGVCASLLELKVGRLLPRPSVEVEEDLLGGASPDLLYARSFELAAFRRMAQELGQQMEEASAMVPRSAGPPPELAYLYPDPMENVTPKMLQEVAAALLAPAPGVDLSHVTPIRASVADALDGLRRQLVLRPEARFRDLLAGCEEPIEVVVRFLALLELYREGRVDLSQAEVFGDIEIRWRGRT